MIVQIVIPVKEIDDKIIAVMFLVVLFFVILSFILALCLELRISSRR
jgi:hypothetical protein